MLYAATSSRIRALILESPFVITTNAAGELIQQDGRRLSRQQIAGAPRPLPPASRRSLLLLDAVGRNARRGSLSSPRISSHASPAPFSFCKETATSLAPPSNSQPFRLRFPILSMRVIPTPVTSLTRNKPIAFFTGSLSSCPQRIFTNPRLPAVAIRNCFTLT